MLKSLTGIFSKTSNNLPKITLSIDQKEINYSLAVQLTTFSPHPYDPIAKQEMDQLMHMEVSIDDPSIEPLRIAKKNHHAIVVDTSYSMLGTGIEIAKKSIETLINLITQDETQALISLISFSSTAELIFERQPSETLTSNKIADSLSKLIPDSGTRIDEGILEVLKLDSIEKLDDEFIFLITDGQNDPGALSAASLKKAYFDKKGVNPKIIVLGIGEYYSDSYVSLLIDNTPWFHLTDDSSIATFIQNKDNLLDKFQGNLFSAHLNITAFNQLIKIPIGDVNINKPLSITLSYHTLIESGFKKSAVDFIFGLTAINFGIEGNDSSIKSQIINQDIGFSNKKLLDYFYVNRANITQLFLSDSKAAKKQALALIRIIPWADPIKFEKFTEEMIKLENKKALLKDINFGCSASKDVTYNSIRLSLINILNNYSNKRESSIYITQGSMLSSYGYSMPSAKQKIDPQDRGQIIDLIFHHDLCDLDENDANAKMEIPFCVFRVDTKTGEADIAPYHLIRSSISALKQQCVNDSLPPDPLGQGHTTKRILNFFPDKYLIRYFKGQSDSAECSGSAGYIRRNGN